MKSKIGVESVALRMMKPLADLSCEQKKRLCGHNLRFAARMWITFMW